MITKLLSNFHVTFIPISKNIVHSVCNPYIIMDLQKRSSHLSELNSKVEFVPNIYTLANTNGCFQLSVLARKVWEFNLSTAFESIDVFVEICRKRARFYRDAYSFLWSKSRESTCLSWSEECSRDMLIQ